MTDDDDRLFTRESALADDLIRRDSDPVLGPPSLLASTTTFRIYPTTAQCFYACLPLALFGAEVEGGPGITTAGAAPFYALNLGGAIPPPGTQVVSTLVGNRWVFRYDG
jgi:hypothetical protein